MIALSSTSAETLYSTVRYSYSPHVMLSTTTCVTRLRASRLAAGDSVPPWAGRSARDQKARLSEMALYRQHGAGCTFLYTKEGIARNGLVRRAAAGSDGAIGATVPSLLSRDACRVPVSVRLQHATFRAATRHGAAADESSARAGRPVRRVFVPRTHRAPIAGDARATPREPENARRRFRHLL